MFSLRTILMWLNIFFIVFVIKFVSTQIDHRSSWVNHQIRPDPRWQLFKHQPTSLLAYANYYPISTAGPLPQLPPTLINVERQTTTPEIVQRQRNEGNFYRASKKPTIIESTTERRVTPTPTPQPKSKPPQSKNKRPHNKHKKKLQLFNRNAAYAAFENKVVHVTMPTTINITKNKEDYRKRRSKELIEDLTTESSSLSQQKLYHDVFMHYAGPQSIAFGHMEKQPGKFTQRFESLNKGKRYRGEVTWHDALTGGYGSQHWDLSQGRLS